MPKTLQRLLSHEASPLVQFIKYGFAGGVATATNILLFFLCGWFLLPCLTESDPVVKLLSLSPPACPEASRALRSIVCSSIGFVVSNFLCWLLNRAFVFRPGKHAVVVELLLFYLASGFSFFLGTGLQYLLVQLGGVETSVAFAANIFTALLVNYAARKFFIFNG